MSNHVFVVSEWLPKSGKEQELWNHFKKLMSLSQAEPSCIRAHATKQIQHAGSPGKSKYTIVLLQEYVDIAAFDSHCESDYVTDSFKQFIGNEQTSIVEDWQCRLFGEAE